MKTELHILTTSVSMLLMVRPVYTPKDTLEAIKAERARLKTLFIASCNHITDVTMLTEVMNIRYARLVSLADRLWNNAPRYNPFHKAALSELLTLIDCLEEHYSGFLKAEQPLSEFERFKIMHKVFSRLDTIEPALRAKGISETLVRQLIKALQDRFNPAKHPVFSRAGQQYLDTFLPNLYALAADQRNKDWNRRLRQLLIQWNFNHMGVYKVLEAEQQQCSSGMRSFQKQHQYLFEQGLWLEQVQPMATSGYNTHATDLKSLLLKQVRSLQVHFAEVAELKRYEAQRKLALTLNVDELAIEFKYNFDDGIFAYPRKQDAAEALSGHVKSKGTDDISYHNLIKFDKTRLHRAAVTVYHRYSRTIEKLAKDFGIGSAR